MDSHAFCKFFFNTNNCRYGNSCRFSHDIEEYERLHNVKSGFSSSYYAYETTVNSYATTNYAGTDKNNNNNNNNNNKSRNRKKNSNNDNINFENICKCKGTNNPKLLIDYRDDLVKTRNMSLVGIIQSFDFNYINELLMNCLEMEFPVNQNILSFGNNNRRTKIRKLKEKVEKDRRHKWWLNFGEAGKVCISSYSCDGIENYENYFLVFGSRKHFRCIFQFLYSLFGMVQLYPTITKLPSFTLNYGNFVSNYNNIEGDYSDYVTMIILPYLPGCRILTEDECLNMLINYSSQLREEQENVLNLQQELVFGGGPIQNTKTFTEYITNKFEIVTTSISEEEEEEEEEYRKNLIYDPESFFVKDENAFEKKALLQDNIDEVSVLGWNYFVGSPLAEQAGNNNKEEKDKKQEVTYQSTEYNDFTISYDNEKILSDFKKWLTSNNTTSSEIFHLHYLATHPSSSLLLSDGAITINETNSAGCGFSAQLSEAVSFELLHRLFSLNLLNTEIGIQYTKSKSKKIDYSCFFVDDLITDEKYEEESLSSSSSFVRIGVSVTRAYFHRTNDLKNNVKNLILKKLKGLHLSKKHVKKDNDWDKNLLFIYSSTRYITDLIIQFSKELRLDKQYSSLFSNTLIFVCSTSFCGIPLSSSYFYRD
eukprot:TRINITY_DN660_c0_g1_i1.p1 TRINITY_DN660_c0_g1~~TRINITY_DN660_c0_g1_i1.p1  ORF type:complete len:650 (-),score=170.66 TRINITY_DN660_c0_g1_i1:108-2057(-)